MRETLISKIKRFSVDAGPGIRATVYLKGCPVNCLFCPEPINISPEIEIQFKPERCTYCGECVRECINHAIIAKAGIFRIIKERCLKCLECVRRCPQKALVQIGKKLELLEIIKEVMSDYCFYKNSNGGITICGGEPLSHPQFTRELVKQLKYFGCHVIVKTCGFGIWEDLRSLAEETDLFVYQIKHVNPLLQQIDAGQPLIREMENLSLLAGEAAKINIRIPMIRGFNNTVTDMEQIIKFLLTIKKRNENITVELFKLGFNYSDLRKEKINKFLKQRSFASSLIEIREARNMFQTMNLPAEILDPRDLIEVITKY